MATDEERNFLQAVYRSDFHATSEALRSPDLRPLEAINSQGLTALHIAALGNNEEMLRHLLGYVRITQVMTYENSPREVLKKWVNRRTPDGSVCLHFAAYQGKLVRFSQSTIELLLDNSADLTLENNEGAGALQFAAQGNHPKAIFSLLRHYEISLHATDKMGKNALHRAAYFGSDAAVELLLALDGTGLLLHSTDTNGSTPLHFAVVSGSTKVVRVLVTRGADPYAKDNKGRSPLAIAKELQQNAVVELMEESKWKIVLGLKSPTRPFRYKYASMVLYLGLFFTLNWVNFSIDLGAFFTLYLTLITLKALLFLTLFLRDPGSLPIDHKQSLEYLYESNDPAAICVPCRRVHSNRSRHCFICGVCVQKFDHHCPWIGNCVGAK